MEGADEYFESRLIIGIHPPGPSMYGIFTYIWLIFMVNVGKYTIHGSYGPRIDHLCWSRSDESLDPPQKNPAAKNKWVDSSEGNLQWMYKVGPLPVISRVITQVTHL